MKILGSIAAILTVGLSFMAFVWAQGITPLRDDVKSCSIRIEQIEGATVSLERHIADVDRVEKGLVRLGEKLDKQHGEVLRELRDITRRR